MDRQTVLLLAFGIVILNVIIGHLFAPTGMFFTPIVLTIVTVLIGFKIPNFNPIIRSVLIFGLIALHDIGIKLYSC